MHSIIVRNVEELDKYFTRLKDAKKELEDLLAKLNADCHDQDRNWEDDQYRAFEEALTRFTDGVSDLMKEDLKDAMDIVSDVLERLM